MRSPWWRSSPWSTEKDKTTIASTRKKLLWSLIVETSVMLICLALHLSPQRRPKRVNRHFCWVVLRANLSCYSTLLRKRMSHNLWRVLNRPKTNTSVSFCRSILLLWSVLGSSSKELLRRRRSQCWIWLLMWGQRSRTNTLMPTNFSHLAQPQPRKQQFLSLPRNLIQNP